MTTAQLQEEIKRIATYSSDEGTSGYLLSEEQFDAIMAKVAEHDRYVIGEDEKQDWDEEQGFCQKCGYQPYDNQDCICVFKNSIRAEQRKRAGL
jgi:hypothetical protein